MRHENQQIFTKDNPIIVKGNILILIHGAGIRVPNYLRRSYSITDSPFALLSRAKIQELILTKNFANIKLLQEVDAAFALKQMRSKLERMIFVEHQMPIVIRVNFASRKK